MTRQGQPRAARHRSRRTAANLFRGQVRERRNHFLLIGAIAAALIGAVLLAVPGSPAYRKPTLGLDLQGGIEVILKAIPERGQQITPSQMDIARNIIEKRVNGIGVTSPNVAVQGGNEIVVQLAGVHDPAKAAALIGKTGKLYFFDFEQDLRPPTVDANGVPTPLPSLYGLLTSVKSEAKKGTPQFYYLFRSHAVTKQVKEKVNGKTVTRPKTVTTHKLLQGPAFTKKQLLQPYGGKQPAGTQVLGVPKNRIAISCPVKNGCIGAGGANGTSKDGTYWYLFNYHPGSPNGPPALTGNDLVESGVNADIGSDTGQPEVTLQFTGKG